MFNKITVYGILIIMVSCSVYSIVLGNYLACAGWASSCFWFVSNYGAIHKVEALSRLLSLLIDKLEDAGVHLVEGK